MSNGMEPEIKKMLMKIVQVISMLTLWAMITIFFGLYLEWAMIRGSFNVFNVIFYVWFVISLTALIYFFYRVWKSE
ncbi:MAG TPA: hypothetical protein VFV68_09120 [Agriterribacter sp.]|nr:hypothetical protein [Agriterribacter sp.]